jgi:DNA-binding GntR family transcriptional regulator
MNDLAIAGPIPRRALHLDAADRLRRAIVAGRLPPGERLKELELCTEFGISRTPLREALRVLAAEACSRSCPTVCATVDLSGEAAEHAQVIAALEAEAAALAAERATDDAADEIARSTRALAAHRLAGDLDGYFAVNEAIHALVLAAARNPLLVDLHERVNTRLRPARFQANLTPERWAAAESEHTALAEAILARDPDRAAALARRHLITGSPADTRVT